MGAYDREYMRDDSSNSFFGGGGDEGAGGIRGWSPVTWLLVANLTVFVVHSLFNLSGDEVWWGTLSFEALKSGLFWTPFTYMFFHAGIFHLLGNMLGLFFIGRALCQLIGGKRFLTVYFVGGILGGLLQALLIRDGVPVLGASGGVFAIIVALATLIPHHQFTMLLFFVIPINTTLKRLAIFLIVFDVALMVLSYTGMFPAMPSLGHLAHLGGAAFGFAYVRYYLQNSQLREFEKERRQTQKTRFGKRVVDAKEVSTPVRQKGSQSFRGERSSYVSPDVDAILDKISAEGMHSLTEEERKVLENSSEQIARRTRGR